MLCTGKWTKILENHGMNLRSSKTMYNKYSKRCTDFRTLLSQKVLVFRKKTNGNILVLSNKSIFTSVWSNAG